MKRQNSTLLISASLMMSGIQKGHLSLILKNWYDWNIKNLAEFSFGNCY